MSGGFEKRKEDYEEMSRGMIVSRHVIRSVCHSVRNSSVTEEDVEDDRSRDVCV